MTAVVYSPSLGSLQHTRLWQVILGAVWFCLSGWLVCHLDWPTDMMAQRTDALRTYAGPFPGVDVTFLLADHLHKIWNFNIVGAMLAASLSALPFLTALILRTTPDKRLPFATALWVVGNPLTWALLLSGIGWASVGLYGLWRLLADLPDRVPHHGMPLVGVGLGGAYLTVPNFGDFLFPLIITLWLVPPRDMLKRHMLVFYLLSFTPVAMIWASYLYTDWLFVGGVSTSAQIFEGSLGGVISSLTVWVGIAVVASGLFFGLMQKGGLSRAVHIFVLAITYVFRPDAGLILAAAFLAQGALSARWGEPNSWRMCNVVGSLAAVLALEALTISGG